MSRPPVEDRDEADSPRDVPIDHDASIGPVYRWPVARDDLPAVLFLHPSDELYGADRQLLALIRASIGLCRPVVLLPNDLDYEGGLSAALREMEVDVRHGPLPVLRRRYGSPAALAGWLLNAIAGSWWMVRQARSVRARLVVTNSTAILAGPVLAGLLRCSHLWFVREIVERPGWYRTMVRIAARSAGGQVLTVSDAVRDWLAELPGRGPATLHDGVAVTGEPEDLPAAPSAVFVGRLNEWKGWEVFVRAASIAHARVPEATFRLVGGVAPGGRVTADIVRAAIRAEDPSGAWLVWAGETADARASMRLSWLVVVPSVRPDPFPNVVLEAMAEGRAVVGSRLGGIPEMIVDGETGWLVEPGDPTALAGAMVRVLADRAGAERLGTAGRRRVRAHFSDEVFDVAWRGFLRKELERRCSGPDRPSTRRSQGE